MIAVNVRYQGREVTGVERYAGEILRCWRGDGGLERTGLRVLRPKKGGSGLGGHLWEQLVLPRQTRKGEVLWSPANSGPLSVRSQVVTIHDASVLEHPEWFRRSYALWYRALLPALARRARRVISDSTFSKERLCRALSIPEDKVRVVPAGVDLERFRPVDPAAVRMRYGLPQRYVLFVGSLEPRKNLGLLLQAWEMMRAEFPQVELVVAGASGHVFRNAALPPIPSGVRLLGRLPEEHLPSLYAGAALFVLPSSYEGFGLTVLEAMACGTAVIAMRAGALPEVVGEAGLLVEPGQAAPLVSAMAQVLRDDGLRRELESRGLERAQCYPWARTAAGVWEVLLEAYER